jgi:hypothetical protein
LFLFRNYTTTDYGVVVRARRMKKWIAVTGLALNLALAAKAQDRKPTVAECQNLFNITGSEAKRVVRQKSFIQLLDLEDVATKCKSYPSQEDDAYLFLDLITIEQNLRFTSYLDRHGKRDEFISEDKRGAR